MIDDALTEPGHVVLVGMMGTGKTTVGQVIATLLGRKFIDSDQQVEERTGQTVKALFEQHGEAYFRAEESAALAEALDAPEPSVIAAAGGVVLDPANRARIKAVSDAGGFVVWLLADPELLIARVAEGNHRPLLDNDPKDALIRLSAQREPFYAEVADVAIDAAGNALSIGARIVAQVTGKSVDIDQVLADTSPSGSGLTVVEVPLGAHAYDVVVGSGALGALTSVVPPRAGRAAIVTQSEIGIEVVPGIESRIFLIDSGESSKNLGAIEQLCRQWAAWGLTRDDVVIAVGGGMVTDVAGFAAATYHRGIDVIHIPTTLLGQIDAAIGGKTGVNLPEGKNLVGAYWQPRAVLCDTDLLTTLPPRELRSGFGEMAKYHFLDDGSFGPEPLNVLRLDQQVARCVAIKAAVVSSDEREGGRRAILNYGHTLGHALEIAGLFDLRHGEAVAIGLIYAAELAHVLGRIDGKRVEEHRHVVRSYGLPIALPHGSDIDTLVTLFGRDKKALAGITFVLDGPDGVETVSGVERTDLDAAFEAMVAHSLDGRSEPASAAVNSPTDGSGAT